jgi:broad specificity phosphatase PhoE
VIYIIRHGQTDLNNRNVLQGRSDFPLNDAGIVQAQEAAKGSGVSAFQKFIRAH